jgi:tRNA pseudouridine55 synthase
VVDAIRHAARIRRVGHAGTLDPMATGVLLVCLDQATRVSRHLMASDKVYRAQIQLGQTTDTDDAEGQVIDQRPVPAKLDEAAIQEVLVNFEGQIDQIPPRYAAIKQKGVPLYKLARRGIDVKPSPRRVSIHSILLLEWRSPSLTVEVHCGPGTYIRALARDVGSRLGCGGHLASLVRLKSGEFSLEETTELDEVVCRLQTPNHNIADILWPLDAALSGMARMTVDVETERRLRQGQQIPSSVPDATEEQPALRRVYAVDGTLVAIVKFDERSALWQPDTVFALSTSR